MASGAAVPGETLDIAVCDSVDQETVATERARKYYRADSWECNCKG